MLVVDVVNYLFAEPTELGEAGSRAVPYIQKIVGFSRQRQIPVIFVKKDVHYASIMGGATKGSISVTETEEDFASQEIIPELAPKPGELIISKTHASAFFCTPLSVYLRQKGIDTLLICGATTSGCVRATTVDAYSNGFRTFLIEEGCFDRSLTSHNVSLFELNAKYADVISFEKALECLGR